MFGKAWFKNWLAKDDLQPESPEQLNEQLLEQAKRLAYRELFRQNRFSGCDGLNEYDLDYSSYAERGDLIPVEMEQALARLQQDEAHVDAEALTEEGRASEELLAHDGTDNIA